MVISPLLCVGGGLGESERLQAAALLLNLTLGPLHIDFPFLCRPVVTIKLLGFAGPPKGGVGVGLDLGGGLLAMTAFAGTWFANVAVVVVDRVLFGSWHWRSCGLDGSPGEIRCHINPKISTTAKMTITVAAPTRMVRAERRTGSSAGSSL